MTLLFPEDFSYLPWVGNHSCYVLEISTFLYVKTGHQQHFTLNYTSHWITNCSYKTDNIQYDLYLFSIVSLNFAARHMPIHHVAIHTQLRTDVSNSMNVIVNGFWRTTWWGIEIIFQIFSFITWYAQICIKCRSITIVLTIDICEIT